MLRTFTDCEPEGAAREQIGTAVEMQSPGSRPRLRVSTSRTVSFTDEHQKQWRWGHLTSGSLLNVFGHLDSRDVAVACCVCQHWQEVGRAQSLWRELLEREFRWAHLRVCTRRATNSAGGLSGGGFVVSGSLKWLNLQASQDVLLTWN